MNDLELQLRMIIAYARDGDPEEPRDTYVQQIIELVHTEKLKLLDEVIHQSTVNLKSARAVAGWAEIRKKQMEAEL